MSDYKQMTAKELIEVLQKIPPETLVEHYDDVYGYQPVQRWTYPIKNAEKNKDGKLEWSDDYSRILLS